MQSPLSLGWRRVRDLALPLLIIAASILAAPSGCGPSAAPERVAAGSTVVLR